MLLPLLLACSSIPEGAILGPSPAGPGAQAPHLSAASDGVRLTWFEPRGDGHVLLTSVRGAKAWTKPAVIAESTDFFVNWADTPSVVLGGDGRWIAHFAEKSGPDTYAYDVQLAASSDGRTWNRLGKAHDDATETEHGFVSMWPTPDGVRLAWLDGRAMPDGGPMGLRTTTVTDHIAPSTEIDGRVCDCCGTDVALAPDGVPVIVYRDRSDSEIRDIRAARLDGTTTPVAEDQWQMPGCPVNGPRIEAVGEHLVAAWTTGASGALDVRAAVSADGGRTFSDPVVVAADTLGRVDLVGWGDHALVSWMEGGEVRVRSLSKDLRAGKATVLGEAVADRASGFPRLALRDDRLMAVWTRPGAGLVVQEVPVAVIEPPTASLSAATAPKATALRSTLPAFTAKTFGGEARALGSGPIVVHLWASWCGPCRSELPALDAFASKAEIPLVGIAVDDRPEAIAKLGPRTFDVLLADSASVRGAFGTSEVPTTLLFDAHGRRIWHHTGKLDHARLASLPTLLR